MKTRGQLRQQTALEQDCEQYKTLFLRLAAESRLALLQLGSVLNQRNADLEKQLRDEQNSFERQRAQFLRQASEVKQVQGRIGELVDGLRQQMKDQRSSHEVTRQRADRLQQEIDSRAGQQQTEAALKKENEELLHRLLQKDIEAQQKQKKLQETVEQLQKRLDEQKSLLEEERARFQQHELGERNAMTRLSSSLSTMLPQLRGLLEAYDQEQERARTTSQQAIADTQAVSQDLTQRLSEQQSAFNQERAQLLQQASDALTTHQDISRRNLAQREAILTCPISLDLFNNPVTTDCCGKTFSEAVLTQALARNPVCPVCRDDYVSSYPSRDLAALVELHRSESVVLGVTSAPPSASTSSAPAPVPQPAPIPTVSASNPAAVENVSTAGRRTQRSRRNSGTSTSRRPRHQQNRSLRAEARSAVARPATSRPNTTAVNTPRISAATTRRSRAAANTSSVAQTAVPRRSTTSTVTREVRQSAASNERMFQAPSTQLGFIQTLVARHGVPAYTAASIIPDSQTTAQRQRGQRSIHGTATHNLEPNDGIVADRLIDILQTRAQRERAAIATWTRGRYRSEPIYLSTSDSDSDSF